MFQHFPFHDSASLRYLITAPLSLRVDAVETVLLQLFGFTNEVRVYVFLKTSMAPNHVVLAQEVVTLNAQNHYQAAAKVRVRHDTQSADIYQHPREAEILITLSLSPAVPQSAGQQCESCDTPHPISRDQPARVRFHQPLQRLPVHPDRQTVVHAASAW